MKTIKIIQQSLLVSAVASTMLLTACQKPAAPTTDEHAEHDHKHDDEHKHEDHDHDAKEADKASATKPAEKGKELDNLLTSYANMALAAYSDSLEGAKQLQAAVDKLVAEPTQANLDAAKAVYKTARNPYSQTEVFRFDEGFVKANEKRGIESVDSWEGQLNAWPLDEALIDYVTDAYEGEYKESVNIINSDKVSIGSESKDTSKITPELLADMNEFGGSEANVASGYHAIEFLLWGQDTNGTGKGAGNRPVTDYSTEEGKCTDGTVVAKTNKTCQRRGEYLKAAAKLLVTDLEAMVAQWQPDSSDTLRADFLARKDDNALRQIMYQMGSLALGELASERMQVAFVTGSTEDEHECFSDLTHNSYAMNAQGIKNVFEGSYVSTSGASKGGYGVKQYLLDMGHKDEAAKLQDQFNNVTSAFDVIVTEAEKNGIKIDQMIATVAQAGKNDVSKEEQEKRRGWMKAAIGSLQETTGGIEVAAAAVGIEKLDADSGSQF